jgi:hypothetical protein
MKRSAYFVALLLLILSAAARGSQYASASDRDETVCPVHHVPLQREKLGLAYGLVAHGPCDTLDRIEAKEKYFPYANSSVYGGFVRDSNSPDYIEIMYCPKCREVEKSWPCLETRETRIITPPRVTVLPTVN